MLLPLLQLTKFILHVANQLEVHMTLYTQSEFFAKTAPVWVKIFKSKVIGNIFATSCKNLIVPKKEKMQLARQKFFIDDKRRRNEVMAFNVTCISKEYKDKNPKHKEYCNDVIKKVENNFKACQREVGH